MNTHTITEPWDYFLAASAAEVYLAFFQFFFSFILLFLNGRSQIYFILWNWSPLRFVSARKRRTNGSLSLWFMIHIFKHFPSEFPRLSNWIGISLRFIHIEIYFFKHNMEIYENHNQKIWAHWRMPMLMYWPKSPHLEKATPILCGVKKKPKICLYYGIACHINKG